MADRGYSFARRSIALPVAHPMKEAEDTSEVTRTALQVVERDAQKYVAELAALRVAIDAGDESGVAEGDVFARVRTAIELPELPRQMRPASCSRSHLKLSALNASRATFSERAHLLHGGHGGVAGERGQQCAVGPAELDGFLRLLAREKAVDEA